ncbi:MAG: hypothetical protein DHS20C05_11930 [Hyphococcus sp.]|nr:MAG: hypothetical protein DHS20C05_11930 [Marinicaulis sp.]
MKSNAPWSVKGIERDARETAKEAAKREGMTVGEWLNQMIYSSGDPEPSGGEVEGLKLRDLITAIEHLHQRVSDSQNQSAENVREVTGKVGEIVERIQRLERVKPNQDTNPDLAQRLEKLEAKSGDRDRIHALKALENAVTQVAVQFSTAQKTSLERLDATERQIQSFAERLDDLPEGAGLEAGDSKNVQSLKEAIDKLSARLERTESILGEAGDLNTQAGGSFDPEFVESTGSRLRILGDEIKRGGDQIRTLENTIEKLSSQIDAAEQRSAEGVQKVSETLVELRETITDDQIGGADKNDIEAAVAAATRETEGRITALQRSFEDMIVRLDSIGANGGLSDTNRSSFLSQAHSDSDDDSFDGAKIFGDIAHGAAAHGLKEDSDEENDDLVADVETNTLSCEPADTVELSDAVEIEEEDPFAFANEIDADLDEPAVENNIEDSSQDSEKDDFNFDLDDGPAEVEQSIADSAAPTAADNNDDFNETVDTVEAAEPVSTSIGDDLDQILADLDGLSSIEKPSVEPTTEEPVSNLGADNVKNEEYEKPLFGAGKVLPAKSTSEEADPADPNKRLRRNLTPKQKAILAARARRKRMAAAATPDQEGNNTTAEKAAKKAAAKNALRGADADYTDQTLSPQGDEDEEKSSPLAGVISALSGLRAKLPFIGDKTDEKENAAESAKLSPQEAATPSATAESERTRNGDRAAFETLKSTASARPVTLALGVAILLSVAVLFFMVKDFIFKSPDSVGPRANIEEPLTLDGSSRDNPGADTGNEVLEVPAAPAIDPSTLYRDALTGLNAAETEPETAAAISKLQEAAALGFPPAQLQLGEFFKTGQGVEQDLARARTWFRRAANGGNVLAMHRIGVMTARGDGGPADTGEAVGWFEQAGNRGLVDSQYNLGAIFHPSNDGPASTIQDPGKAYYWYSLAAKNGDEQAAPLAASVAAALSPEQIRSLNQSIEDWEALPSDSEANEITPAG